MAHAIEFTFKFHNMSYANFTMTITCCMTGPILACSSLFRKVRLAKSGCLAVCGCCLCRC
jgi:hypothetical protein